MSQRFSKRCAVFSVEISGKAEELAKEAADISQQIGIAELDGIFGTHMFTIRREQGRMNEVAQILKILLANNPSSSAWRPVLALIYSSLGQLEEASSVFKALAADGFASIPQDSLWVGTMAYLSEVCAFLRDDAQATIFIRYAAAIQKPCCGCWRCDSLLWRCRAFSEHTGKNDVKNGN
jgi:hypothetical protein